MTIKEKREWLYNHTTDFNNSKFLVENDFVDYIDNYPLHFKDMENISILPFKFRNCSSALNMENCNLINLNNIFEEVSGYFNLQSSKMKDLDNFPNCTGYIFIDCKELNSYYGLHQNNYQGSYKILLAGLTEDLTSSTDVKRNNEWGHSKNYYEIVNKDIFFKKYCIDVDSYLDDLFDESTEFKIGK